MFKGVKALIRAHSEVTGLIRAQCMQTNPSTVSRLQWQSHNIFLIPTELDWDVQFSNIIEATNLLVPENRVSYTAVFYFVSLLKTAHRKTDQLWWPSQDHPSQEDPNQRPRNKHVSRLQIGRFRRVIFFRIFQSCN